MTNSIGKTGASTLRLTCKTAVITALIFAGVPFVLAEEEEQESYIEEIVVTAERRSENLQDVPISITALTNEDLQNLHIQTAVELSAQVPNLLIQGSSGENSYVYVRIRGVSSVGLTYAAGTPALVYSDDQLLDSQLSHGMAFFDLQGVEVLRGPQGTLFGRNSTSGALSVRSARPGEELSGYGQVSYGDLDETRFEGAFGGPISDTLAFRLAGFIDTKDGGVENINGGGDLGGAEEYGVRAMLELSPSDDLNIFLKAQIGRADRDPFVQASSVVTHTFAGYGLDDALLFNPGPSSNYEKVNSSLSSDQKRDDLDDDQFNLTVEWALGDTVLTSVTGIVDLTWDLIDDYDASAAALQHTGSFVEYEGFTQEVRLASISDSPFQWIIGAFYLDSDTTDTHYGEATDFYALYGIPAYPGFGYGNANTTSTDSQSRAVFGHSTYAWSDRLTTTHAIRFTRDKQDRVKDRSTFTLFEKTSPTSFANYAAHSDASGAPLVGYTDAASWDETTWRLAVDYAVADDRLMYLSLTRGYKAGLLGGLFDSVLGRYHEVAPETVLSYEVGLKSRWLDNRVQVNTAVFFYDYEDYQSWAQLIDENLNVKTVDINIPQVDLKGFEVEVLAEPIDNLTISFGYGWVENEITNYVNLASLDLSGNEVALSPRHDATGYIRYEFPLADNSSLSSQLDWSYTGEYFNGNENFAKFGGFATYNARLVYTNERRGGVTVAAFVENIGDEQVQIRGFPEYIPQTGFDYYVQSDPRTWGITIRSDF